MQPKTQPRLEFLDIARGVALIAMAIYHFAWDLEFFGYLEPTTTEFGGWRVFARLIASSFLFIVGISLFLAHGRGIRWRSFFKRLAVIVAAALAISLVTFVGTRDAFIFFGILHQIALGSLLGLAFLRLPALVTLAVAAAVVAAPHFLRAGIFDHPAFWWIGLSTQDPPSNDYVPLFPWFGAVLAGIAAARLAERFGLIAPWRGWAAPRISFPLIFLGRHSLAFYLLHQPVLIGLVWAFAQFAPPQVVSVEDRFVHACEATCGQTRDRNFCPRYCACVLDRLSSQGRLDDLFSSGQDAQAQSGLNDIAAACTFETDSDVAPQKDGGQGQ